MLIAISPVGSGKLTIASDRVQVIERLKAVKRMLPINSLEVIGHPRLPELMQGIR